jgi:hypothetical protein
VAIIALVAGKGSPGVTSSALALTFTWPLRAADLGKAPARVLMVEMDGAGSSAGPGYLRGEIDQNIGMTSVLAGGPNGMGSRIQKNVLVLDGTPRRYLLLGLSGPRQMAAAKPSWPVLAAELHAMSEAHPPADILLDMGRFGAAAEPTTLLQETDLILVVCRSSLASIGGAVQAIRYIESWQEVAGLSTPIACLLVGDRQPYPRSQIAASLGVPVVGALGWDPQAAAVFAEGAAPGRGFRRGPLMRSAAAAASAVMDLAIAQPAPAALEGRIHHG